GDEVGVRRDGRGRIDLQERQSFHDGEQALRARRVEQLGAHRDPPRLLLRQPMHRENVRDPALRPTVLLVRIGKRLMAKPLIGITTYVEPASWGHWHVNAALVPYDYVRAVERAGGR